MTPDPVTGQPSPQPWAEPGPMVPTMYRVAERIDEPNETVTLVLEPIDGPIAHPRPGQFNMLWAFGIGEAPISLASLQPTDGQHRLVHTIRVAGEVTANLCQTPVGGSVGVRGPYGNGWDLEQAKGRDVLVVAGGLGLVPVRPIIEEVLRRRDEFGRLALVVGARSPEALLYRPIMDRWASTSELDIAETVDTASPSWRGNVGLVTKLLDPAPVDMATAAVFTCGPEVMMWFVANAAIERGASAERLQVSLERNMHCAIGHCGHCQLGPAFICKDGPVLSWAVAEPLMAVRAR